MITPMAIHTKWELKRPKLHKQISIRHFVTHSVREDRVGFLFC